MVPAMGTVVPGVNTSMGVTDAPAVVDATLIAVKIICPKIAAASLPVERAGSALDDILKPAVLAALAAPRVSPFSVTVTAEVPVAAPPVVRTIVVLAAVAADADVAVNPPAAVMEVTVPKK